MKTLKTTVLIGIITILASPVSMAQNFDANRMNRDLKIMENILGEIFKTKINSMDRNHSSSFISLTSARSSTNVKGTYLPGYGVIFMVPAAMPSSINVVRNGDEEAEIIFQYNSDQNGDGRTVDEESVTIRITEFLRDYASTIGQLKNNEHVLVIYGGENNLSSKWGVYSVFSKNGEKVEKRESLPVISVSAQKNDLEAYRGGRLSGEDFKNRLAISTSENKEYLDLKVMSNIFETALRNSEGEAFRITGGVNHLLLDNFGALFSFDVRYGGHQGHFSTIAVNDFSIRRNIGSNVVSFSRDSAKSEKPSAEELEEKEREEREKMEAAFVKLKSEMSEYIVDYGRTLSSVESDQFILTTVTLQGWWSQNKLPERLDFQIKKSVLEQLDRGSISRGEAIKAVTITEY